MVGLHRDRPIDQLRGHRDHASRSSDASRSEVPEVITVCGCAVRRKICDLLKSDVVRFLELTPRIPTHVPVVRGGRSADRRGAPRRRAARGRATDKVLPRRDGEAVGCGAVSASASNAHGRPPEQSLGVAVG